MATVACVYDSVVEKEIYDYEHYLLNDLLCLGHPGRDEGPGPEPRRAGGHRYDQRGRQQRSRVLS